MRKLSWPKRDPIKNYFPLPNEIFSLGLSAGAIAVYGFLLHREDRRTYQCVAREIQKDSSCKKRPPNCCNSSAARRVSENTA